MTLRQRISIGCRGEVGAWYREIAWSVAFTSGRMRELKASVPDTVTFFPSAIAFAVALLAVRSLLIMHRRVRLCIGIYVVCRLYECVREKKQQDAKNDADHGRIPVLIAAIQSMHARTSFTS
jgi:hypothetical protein